MQMRHIGCVNLFLFLFQFLSAQDRVTISGMFLIHYPRNLLGVTIINELIQERLQIVWFYSLVSLLANTQSLYNSGYRSLHFYITERKHQTKYIANPCSRGTDEVVLIDNTERVNIKMK